MAPEGAARHLLNMDPPDHGRYRRVTSKQFTPRGVQALSEKVERLTREVLDDVAKPCSAREIREVHVEHVVLLPALRVEVPPLRRQRLEAGPHHGLLELRAVRDHVR